MNGAFYVNHFIKNLQKKKCFDMKFWPAYVSLILIAPGPNPAPISTSPTGAGHLLMNGNPVCFSHKIIK